MNFSVFKNKKIIITGHTGFKGSWLSLWLYSKGAKVIGVSKNIPTQPSLFKILKLKSKIKNYFTDLNLKNNLREIIKKHQPDYIFHLAAQAIVSKSYTNPKDTFISNAIGTLNILESLKYLKKKCYIIIITSDKSYKNIELKRGYHEEDLLGGKDPYSASKACAENIIYSYFESFFKKKKNLKIVIARAGNVIGGGDWSDDRLIPDCIRSIENKNILKIRNPNSTRPWLHVFEVLSGYLLLSLYLKKNKKLNGQAFNFGPNTKKAISVKSILKYLKENFKQLKWKIISDKNFFESKLLMLNSSKAKRDIKWKSVLSNKEKIDYLVDWYKCYFENKKECAKFSIFQIKKFEKIFFKKLTKQKNFI